MKYKTSKLKKLERERFSVFTDDLEHCYFHNYRPRTELHELVFGSNRNNSMRYGYVLPLCNECHRRLQSDSYIIKEWKKKCQEHFEESHSRDEWISIFHRNYLD